jgi:uncharacterized integral membrane protein
VTFIAQNTRQVEVSSLWMQATTSMAVATLASAVAGAVVAAVIGTARIVQLRRAVRSRRDAGRADRADTPI